METSCPTSQIEFNENVSVIDPGLEFPLEQCHYGAGIEITITSALEDLYFIRQAALGIDD